MPRDQRHSQMLALMSLWHPKLLAGAAGRNYLSAKLQAQIAASNAGLVHDEQTTRAHAHRGVGGRRSGHGFGRGLSGPRKGPRSRGDPYPTTRAHSPSSPLRPPYGYECVLFVHVRAVPPYAEAPGFDDSHLPSSTSASPSSLSDHGLAEHRPSWSGCGLSPSTDGVREIGVEGGGAGTGTEGMHARSSSSSLSTCRPCACVVVVNVCAGRGRQSGTVDGAGSKGQGVGVHRISAFYFSHPLALGPSPIDSPALAPPPHANIDDHQNSTRGPFQDRAASPSRLRPGPRGLTACTAGCKTWGPFSR